MPLEGHDVDAPRPGRRAFAQHERRHVVQHAAQAADEAVAADRREMMHGHGAAERGVIVDVHVPAQQRAVGHDDVVAQLAVVGHVAAGHQEILVADPRDAVFFFAAAIDRDAFADDVAVADDDLRVAAGVADVLRLAADDDVGIDDVVAADRHVAHDRDRVQQPRAALDAHVRADDARTGRFRRPRRSPPPNRPTRFQQCGLPSLSSPIAAMDLAKMSCASALSSPIVAFAVRLSVRLGRMIVSLCTRRSADCIEPLIANLRLFQQPLGQLGVQRDGRSGSRRRGRSLRSR